MLMYRFAFLVLFSALGQDQVASESFLMSRTLVTYQQGKAVEWAKTTIAKRGDGSVAVIESVPPLSAHTFERNLKFTDGKSVTVYDSIKAKTTWPRLSQDEIAGLLQTTFARDCDVRAPSKFLRFDHLRGQDVAVIQNAAEGYVVTRWMAPALACRDLYYRIEAPGPDGKMALQSETRLDKLVIGEPDPDLFEIGASYTEMKPSAASARLYEQMGVTLSPEEAALEKKALEEADERYSGQQE
jgi:hypothetical protein